MPKTKPLRLAVEGATVDGRTIDRNWIEQMAANYNPQTYSARVNCEHIRGLQPDGPFKAYGTVDTLAAEEVELQIAGKTEKRLALLGTVDGNDELVALSKKNQKIYPSCEISPDFAQTGKAGLVGLAITDNPASLGTEMLTFAAGAQANPLAPRKQNAANYFSASDDAVAIEFAEDQAATEPSETTTLMKGITAFFSKLGTGDGGGDSGQPAAPPPSPPPPPTPANDNPAAQFGAHIGQLATAVEALSGKVDGFGTRFSAIETEQTRMKESIENTEAPGQFSRSPATGAGETAKTDC